MITVKDITDCIEAFCPLRLQESWDNSGLITGNPLSLVTSAVITLDITENVIDDAIAHGDNLIISHHPILLGGIKKINGNNETERCIIKAIKHDIALYSAHTNIDAAPNGVSFKMAQKLDLKNVSVLSKSKAILKKLIVFVPTSHAVELRNALFDAGAGNIGNYSNCSFNNAGYGTFCGNENSKPFAGQKGELHTEEELRIETVFPFYIQSKLIKAMLLAHPYEEVAYDIIPIENQHEKIGFGAIGEIEKPISAKVFLQLVKEKFHCQALRFVGDEHKLVRKIALCGGSGSSFIQEAISSKADVFITGDLKYHQFADSENEIILADIGHYESEQFTKELFYEIVTNKFSKFALRLSDIRTNPVKYLF
jgi:dinuclear metal center YbgI/SA1388 family protein